MNDKLIYVEPGQDALMVCGEVTVACRSVPEAYLMWAQLEQDEKERAVIQVGDDIYDISAIRRLRYEPLTEAERIAEAA
jgi:hypothetical protein